MRNTFGCPLWHFPSCGAIVFSAGWRDPSLLIRKGYFAIGPDPASCWPRSLSCMSYLNIMSYEHLFYDGKVPRLGCLLVQFCSGAAMRRSNPDLSVCRTLVGSRSSFEWPACTKFGHGAQIRTARFAVCNFWSPAANGESQLARSGALSPSTRGFHSVNVY